MKNRRLTIRLTRLTLSGSQNQSKILKKRGQRKTTSSTAAGGNFSKSKATIRDVSVILERIDNENIRQTEVVQVQEQRRELFVVLNRDIVNVHSSRRRKNTKELVVVLDRMHLNVQTQSSSSPSRSVVQDVTRDDCLRRQLYVRLEGGIIEDAQPSSLDRPVSRDILSSSAPVAPVQIPITPPIIEPVGEPAVPVVVRPPLRRHAAIPKKNTWRLARIVTAEALERLCARTYRCGEFNEHCLRCNAKFFRNEPRNRQGIRLSCCKNGSYVLPVLGPCPPSLIDLYTGNDARSVQFRNEIRLINSLFAMASFKTSRPAVEIRGQGHWCFSICGQIYHYTEGVPDEETLQRPRLQHYYFLDVAAALGHRQTFAEDRVEARTLEIIETTLRNVNRYIRAYSTMGEVMREERLQGRRDVDDIVIGIVSHSNMNVLRRNFNLPESRSDVAAVFRGMEPPFNVDLRLYPRTNVEHGAHHELKNLNPMADPMVYPLLFPCGDNGYRSGIVYLNRPAKTVTLREFYRYRIQVRDGFSALHCGGKLFQQYLVDMWVKVEANLLWWLKQNQIKFRRAQEEALRRYNENRARGEPVERIGRACVLPASFYGGERHRQRQYLDAMAVVARHGKPDLFITFTCNPRWPEISGNLQHRQKWENRPDLVCRVFHIKLLEFMDDLVHKQLYGVLLNYHYVIEFQKRGLPHAHIMITFVDGDKLLDSEAVDSVVSAVIPDRLAQPLLYARVGEFQIHKPCGAMNPQAPCMRNNRCGKFYPKDFAEGTILRAGDNHRPIYKRPRDGRTILVPGTHVAVTNKRIVPYNPHALAKYSCHINFEAVGSLMSMKYLYKYVSKGPDSITLVAEDRPGDRIRPDGADEPRGRPDDAPLHVYQIDEIQKYLDCRYVSAMEAAWRLLEFKMSDRSHAVLVLPVHLPGERVVVYDELNDDNQDIERRLGVPSKLEAWFALNRASLEARRYKYVQIPEHYTWDFKEGEWRSRRQIAKMIGCIAEVGPSAGQMEKHYLRMLLSHIPGAMSFEDLRTVDGEVLLNFEAACRRRNFLLNLDEYDLCLAEAAIIRHPRRLRRLFALICCVVVDQGLAQIPILWRRYSCHMIEDLVRGGLPVRPALLAAAQHIEEIVGRNKELTLAHLGISVADVVQDNERHYAVGFGEDARNPPVNVDDDDDDERRQRRLIYDVASLNNEQKQVFGRVLLAVSRSTGIAVPEEIMQNIENVAPTHNLLVNRQESVFYVDGPGGTGKTYIYNTLLTVVREIFHRSTVAVAWTGIAANLLTGGQTVHRAFRLPLTLDEETVAGWPLQHEKTDNLKNVALIVWDEAPMTPKLAVEAVDRYLREIFNTPRSPMGGRVVLFGGDFRQILPVVVGGHRTEVIHSTLKFSRLWPEMIKLQLTENMRADPGQLPDPLLGHDTFANWLLRLGDGRLPYVTLAAERAAPNDLIEIPASVRVPSYEDLISFVYEDDYTSPAGGSKAILCPTNAAVDTVNFDILNRIPGESKTYISVDSYKRHPEDDFHVPLDVLHSINCPSLPPHELTLKIGATVILLRNIDIDDGQCNGTRLRVTGLYEHLIECELLCGSAAGTKLWLPKIKMTAKDTSLPSELVRIQFPIKLAFAITINKAQGQTMTKVGVFLNRPCFTHGQLYVALSRVGSVRQFKIFIENGTNQGTFKFRGRRVFTRNVVYFAVLAADVMPIPPRDLIPDPDEDQHVITSDVANNLYNDPWEVNDDTDETDDPQSDVDQDNVEEDVPLVMGNVRGEPAVPYFTEDQLMGRRAVGDRPGTSGIRDTIMPHRVLHVSDSDSD